MIHLLNVSAEAFDCGCSDAVKDLLMLSWRHSSWLIWFANSRPLSVTRSFIGEKMEIQLFSMALVTVMASLFGIGTTLVNLVNASVRMRSQLFPACEVLRGPKRSAWTLWFGMSGGVAGLTWTW